MSIRLYDSLYNIDLTYVPAHFQFGFVLRGRFAETATVKGTRKLRILEGEGRLINLDKILLLDEFADD